MPPDANIVRVVAAPHPLRAAHVALEVGQGDTLAQMLEAVQPDPVLRAHAAVWLDGERVERSRWDVVVPRSGQEVVIKTVAHGSEESGKTPERIVLTILLIVAVVATQGAASSWAAGLGVGSTGSAIIGGLAAAAVAVAGGYALNAIAPLEFPDDDDEGGRQYDIAGGRNRLRPYGTIPVVLGRHRFVPPLGAKYYTEIVGDDQYLRMLVVWGYGPLRISDIRIGATPLSDFDGVRVQTRQGFPTDTPITLYPGSVSEEGLTVEMSSTPATRVSAEADELSIDITFPRGLGRINNSGRHRAQLARAWVSYRKVNDDGTYGDWLCPSASAAGSASSFPSAWSRAVTTPQESCEIAFTHYRTEPIRHGLRWRTPERARYEVSVAASPLIGSGDVFGDMVWTALRAFRDDPPVDFDKPLAMTALVIKASGQLTGAVADLNALVESVGRSWDGSAWIDSSTSRNPADLYRLLLQHPGRTFPTADDELDLPGLQDWHERCAAEGWEYNRVWNSGGSVWDALREVAAAGRASPRFADGKRGVVVDDGMQLPVQHFTPRNTANFRAERLYDRVPGAVRVQFNNENMDYRRDERLVYRDGFDADGEGGSRRADYIITLEARGITSPDAAHKWGRFHLAQMLLRREAWSFDVDFEYLVATRGDRAKLTHDVLLVGLSSARVKEVGLSGGAVTRLVLDDPVEFRDGESHGVSIRTADDAALVRGVSNALLQPGEVDLSSYTGLYSARGIAVSDKGLVVVDERQDKVVLINSLGEYGGTFALAVNNENPVGIAEGGGRVYVVDARLTEKSTSMTGAEGNTAALMSPPAPAPAPCGGWPTTVRPSTYSMPTATRHPTAFCESARMARSWGLRWT